MSFQAFKTFHICRYSTTWQVSQPQVHNLLSWGVSLKKCLHSPESNAINSFPGHWTVGNLYGKIHNFEASKAKGSTFEALNEFY